MAQRSVVDLALLSCIASFLNWAVRDCVGKWEGKGNLAFKFKFTVQLVDT